MPKSKYTIKEDFFKRPTKLNSYWAGFIAADGCITNAVGRSPILKINLSSKDRTQLENFQRDVQYTGVIYDYDNNHNNKKSALHISNQQIIKDLDKVFNIRKRKTFDLQEPNLNSKSHHIAYLIGFIDGDGSIYIAGRKKQTIAFSIVNASLGIMLYIQRILKDYCDLEININTTTGGYHSLKVEGKRAEKLYNQLYKINVPKMIRKWRWPVWS